jgi:deoxyribonuclease-4
MPYSINLAREYFKPRTVEDSRLNITDALIKQLKTTNSFKGCGAVVHIGQQVEMDYVTAMNNMTRNVTIAASHSSPECPLLIETDSGGSLIDNPSDLADFWINLDHSIRNNVAICLDTCHVFAAGYDNLETLLMFRDKGVPVRLIHYNDSKFPKGSKKDRHESFGKGLVGCENLINVAKFAVLHNIPMVTE